MAVAWHDLIDLMAVGAEADCYVLQYDPYQGETLSKSLCITDDFFH